MDGGVYGEVDGEVDGVIDGEVDSEVEWCTSGIQGVSSKLRIRTIA